MNDCDLLYQLDYFERTSVIFRQVTNSQIFGKKFLCMVLDLRYHITAAQVMVNDIAHSCPTY